MAKYTTAIVFTFLGALVMPGMSVAEHPHDAVRPTFSDPNAKAPVPKGWQDKVVQYDKKVSDADMVISLGKQMHPLLKDFIQQYASEHDLKIVLNSGSCGVSAKKLLKKQIDIGGYCCPPAYTDRLPGLEFHTVAIAPLVLITHPDNPVSNITLSEARDIFRGAIRNWSAVESNDASQNFSLPVQPIARLHCKVRPGHWKLILDNEDKFSAGIYSVGVIPDMISKVANTRNMIGYETLFMLKEHKSQGEVKVMKVDGVDPADLENVKTGKYPFYRTYNLTAWVGDKNYKQSMALIEKIKTYVNSSHQSLGFVPVSQLREAGWGFKGDELIAEVVVADGDGHTH